ncbi:surface-adhesin E family protein [Longimicrobium sp.]|uniref:surface-adhesin E family protein n=1 Tax=Longimicrobium sp. TaxID=2029185 RepID=UPI002E2F42C7|nr:surface-adhesin E family protein [Longimicrobium sp.]HEX6037011.1 surface-adhesin E family protein [Longimicrobium sp.]
MMRRILLSLPISLALAVAAPPVAHAQLSVPQVVQRSGPAVVSLKTFDARGREMVLGSGFILRDGRIVTNAHVVEGAARVDVYDADERLLGTARHAEALDADVDIAVLPGMGAARNTVQLAREAPTVGEEVVAIGAPEGLTNTVSNGIVSAYREVEGQRMMQITAPLSEGSSGGPVLNRRGEVVGVSVAIYQAGQNLNFAVPLDDVRAVVDRRPGRVAFAPASAGGGGRGRRRGDADQAGEMASGRTRPPAAIRVGQPAIAGTLEAGDAAFTEGGYFDLYHFQARRGQRLTVTLRSDDFDAYLRVAHARSGDDVDWLGEDDDGGLGTDSRLTVTAPADGEYWIAVSAYDEEPGAYELAVRDAGAGAGGSTGDRAELDDRWIAAGETETFERFVDRTRITPQGNGVYRVWVRSIYADPYTDEYGDTYDNVLSRMDYDCTRRRWRAVQVIQYLGTDVVWRSDDEPGDWDEWVPESVGETTGETACRVARGG